MAHRRPNHTSINAEAAVADPGSVFHHYRRLIELRHTLPAVVHGDYRLLLPADGHVFAYVRTLGDERLLVVANLSGQSVEVDLGGDAALLVGDLLITSHDDGAAPTGGRLTPPPGSPARSSPAEPPPREPSATAGSPLRIGGARESRHVRLLPCVPGLHLARTSRR